MIKLLNGDVCTELKVSPKNWEGNKGALKKDWFIYYPKYIAGAKNRRLIILKGMNHLHGFDDQISKTKESIDAELKRLKNEAVKISQYQIGKTTCKSSSQAHHSITL